MSTSYNPQIVSTNMRLYYDVGNKKSYPGTGAVIADLSGRDMHGIVSGSPIFTTDGGGSFHFQGDASKQNIHPSQGFSGINSENFTICGWFKTDQSTNHKIFGFEDALSHEGGANHDKELYVNTSGNLTGGVYNSVQRGINGTVTCVDNIWHHFAFVHSQASGVTIYMDAVSLGNQPYISTDAPAQYLRIASFRQDTGWPLSQNSGYFSGSIGLISLQYSALRHTEVVQNFNAHRARFGV